MEQFDSPCEKQRDISLDESGRILCWSKKGREEEVWKEEEIQPAEEKDEEDEAHGHRRGSNSADCVPRSSGTILYCLSVYVYAVSRYLITALAFLCASSVRDRTGCLYHDDPDS